MSGRVWIISFLVFFSLLYWLMLSYPSLCFLYFKIKFISTSRSNASFSSSVKVFGSLDGSSIAFVCFCCPRIAFTLVFHRPNSTFPSNFSICQFESRYVVNRMLNVVIHFSFHTIQSEFWTKEEMKFSQSLYPLFQTISLFFSSSNGDFNKIMRVLKRKVKKKTKTIMVYVVLQNKPYVHGKTGFLESWRGW